MLATEQKIGEKEEPDAAVSKWPLPFNISLDKVELILKGYYRAGADQHPVSAADLASTTGLNALTIKANSKFLANIGWLKLVDRNQYTLTTSGTDFVKSLSSADGIGVANLIRIAIEKSPLQDLLNFIDLRGKDQLSYDQLFNHVKTMARLPENPKYPRGIAAPYITGINTVLDLFIKGGILPPEARRAKTEPTSTSRTKHDGGTTLPRTPTTPTRDIKGTAPTEPLDPDFVQLRSDDFLFRVRKTPAALDFAKAQFQAWMDYLRQSLSPA